VSVEGPSAPPPPTLSAGPGLLGPPRSAVIRWTSRARSITELEQELARMWASEPQTPENASEEEHVQARTSVLNLMVVARSPEMGQRAAATISRLSGRHPSRTIILLPADPDGPRWVDAQVQAVCMVPSDGGHQTCAEIIYLTAGGDAGRHLDSLVSPLLIHDLPVAVWWPGDIPFGARQTFDLIQRADRFIVDGSSWSGSGRDRLVRLADVCGPQLSVCDFGLMRQSRWREAIASTFDMTDFLPYLRSIRRIAVTYGTHDDTGDPEGTNIVKPVYHVGWLASRLGMRVVEPLRPMGRRRGGSAATTASTPTSEASARRGTRRSGASGKSKPSGAARAGAPVPGGFDGRLRIGSTDVDVVLRPRLSTTPSGTTLRVELLCERRGSELRADVTAETDTVHVRVWQNGVEAMERRYHAPRRTDVDLLAETIERTGSDPVATAAVKMAGELVRLPDEEGGA
jgi:glucose-6-phosphate dehydrogenase assembly protein OpcA